MQTASGPHIAFRLFGDFEVRATNGTASDWKALPRDTIPIRLLKELALAPSFSRREDKLFTRLIKNEQAYSQGTKADRLRQYIMRANKLLSGTRTAEGESGYYPWIKSERKTAKLFDRNGVWTDVARFNELWSRADAPRTTAELREAITLYRGELLSEDVARTSASWASALRVDYHEKFLLLLEETIDLAHAAQAAREVTELLQLALQRLDTIAARRVAAGEGDRLEETDAGRAGGNHVPGAARRLGLSSRERGIRDRLAEALTRHSFIVPQVIKLHTSNERPPLLEGSKFQVHKISIVALVRIGTEYYIIKYEEDRFIPVLNTAFSFVLGVDTSTRASYHFWLDDRRLHQATLTKRAPNQHHAFELAGYAGRLVVKRSPGKRAVFQRQLTIGGVTIFDG
jgi:DNA-binding SARP family transcriptional activator